VEKIFLTGGTGTFGKAFIEWFLENSTYDKLAIYSRDEYKQYLLRKKYHAPQEERLQFVVGDVRDKKALSKAMKGYDYVIHAAALKQVSTLEYYPHEAIQTNLLGTENVIKACLENNIKKAVLLSTDKAVEPINAYGMSKALAEKLWAQANTYNSTQFIITRYGNVAGSRGSLIPSILDAIKKGKRLMITHPESTRFWLDIEDAVKLVVQALGGVRGTIYIPYMKSFRVMDLISIYDNNPTVMGLRPGEKIHEVITTQYEKSFEDNECIVVFTLFYNNDIPVFQYKRRTTNDNEFLSKDTLRWKIRNVRETIEDKENKNESV